MFDYILGQDRLESGDGVNVIEAWSPPRFLPRYASRGSWGKISPLTMGSASKALEPPPQTIKSD